MQGRKSHGLQRRIQDFPRGKGGGMGGANPLGGKGNPILSKISKIFHEIKRIFLSVGRARAQNYFMKIRHCSFLKAQIHLGFPG